MTQQHPTAAESAVLQTILSESHVSAFFQNVWQKSCGIFASRIKRCESTPIDALSDEELWNFYVHDSNPYLELIRRGWDELMYILEEARSASESPHGGEIAGQQPLLFKNREQLTPEARAMHGGSLFSAFLDGCSVVLNHADALSPWVSALCQDLQKSFPHAYANIYLTPPSSQTVPPHADDRDVFIIQVYGKKKWTVYKQIPVPYPYSHEQVGKNGLAVPEEVLTGPKLLEKTLHPGDVLYMPRGYVHEAVALADHCSFHVTIALATHDWSMAGIVSKATESVLSTVIDYRRAVPREIGTRNFTAIPISERADLQMKLDTAMALLQEKITAEFLHSAFSKKFEMHNQRALVARQACIKRAHIPKVESTNVVGRDAARTVNWNTSIRLASDHEKASVHDLKAARGLHVRERSFKGIIHILQLFRESPKMQCEVSRLREMLPSGEDCSTICDVTLLCFAKQCVEFGALAIAARR
jgi:ribosomal protein L16 Arg81 hydroxylase